MNYFFFVHPIVWGIVGKVFQNHGEVVKSTFQFSDRQGDVISPKLFTAALEDVFKLLDWSGLGININGEYITHLRFADDIVVMAETLEDLGTMLDGLSRVSQQVGLKMNMDKTKIMSNVRVAPTPLKVGDSALEVVDEYVYLGQTVQLGKPNFEKGVNREASRYLLVQNTAVS
ncbi:hypothetical protein ABMA28_006816 [Loxostege sticticalis]|uniref:Reverse transcriptase domain-containing protein n=1 Tax=Loxostege sticticalis TaxID=481309 RepID=A0ABD0TNG8_LOXSC